MRESTVKVDAVHGFPTEESITSFGSLRGDRIWTSGELLQLVTRYAKRPGLHVRRVGPYVLSTANGVFFFFSFQRCFHYSVVQYTTCNYVAT